MASIEGMIETAALAARSYERIEESSRLAMSSAQAAGAVVRQSLDTSAGEQFSSVILQAKNFAAGLTERLEELTAKPLLLETEPLALPSETVEVKAELTDVQADPVDIQLKPIWESNTAIERFEADGVTRYQMELEALQSMMRRVSEEQHQLGAAALEIELLPPNAVWDISLANEKVESLKTLAESMMDQDISLVSDENIGKINMMFEAVRESMNQTLDLQENLSIALESGNLDGINEAYNQLHAAASVTGRKIQENIGQIQTLSDISWQPKETAAVFNLSGVQRFRQEMEAAEQTMSRLRERQQAIQTTAGSVRAVPPELLTDLQAADDRLNMIHEAILRIENNPLNKLGADSANGELEKLRSYMAEICQEQGKLNDSIGKMDFKTAQSAYEGMHAALDKTAAHIRDNTNEQGRFNSVLKDSVLSADTLTGKLYKAVTGLISVQNFKAAGSWIKETMDVTAAQFKAEQQLSSTLSRIGSDTSTFERLKETAADIQSRTTHSDEVMMGGAAVMAVKVADGAAVESLMGTLADYAAGMSGGASVSFDKMTEYAGQLSKAMDGSLDGFEEMGFRVSEAQRQIIENGSDMEKALVIDEIVAQSWENMGEKIRNTPQGQLEAMQNAFNSIREEVGARLYPVVTELFEKINTCIPQLEPMFAGMAGALQVIIMAAAAIFDVFSLIFDFVMDNWPLIEPVIFGVAAALAVFHGWLLLTKLAAMAQAAVQGIMSALKFADMVATEGLTAAIIAQKGAQDSLNTSMLACPLVWILIMIIAIIAAVYAIVAAINKVTGSTISATGVIVGALMVAVAFIGNLFVMLANAVIGIFVTLWNFIGSFANFFANVFNDPVGSIARLFFDLADTVLGVLETLAKAIDTLFGSNLSGAVRGWRDNLGSWVDDKFGKGEEVFQKLDANDLYLDRFEYGSAWDKGYGIGEGIDDKLAGLKASIGFDEMDNLPDPNDYVVDYNQALDQDYSSGSPAADLSSASVPSNVDSISQDTSAIKNEVSASSEELKYLREIAERQAINRFTTAEVKLEVSTEAVLNQDMDIDTFVDLLTGRLSDELIACAEGVHI